ncbi:phage tail tube protein [Sphingobium bisphenolivorans]|uniref:phage tail tube protein n=1 Tax=Sphingobium bisphenolivorans TaxID=1335760 RepID=UPI0003AA2DA3|nr:phage tail tube protein [Sphingobium bisphenolivorans]
MTVAQGINKTIAYKKQTALGSAASGSGGTYLRRVTAALNVTKDSYENNEIVSHQQGTGMTHGIAKSGGTLNGLLSGTSWMPFLGSLLRKDPAATSAISSLSLTIAASAPNYTITRGSGDFLTGGVKIGDVIQLSGGSLAAGNVAKNLVVVGVTATVLTVNVLNYGGTLTAEGPIASCTVTVMGKKSWVPTTGHTNDYYTFEEYFSDLTRSRVYPDVQIAQADISMPATGNVTINHTLVGLGAVTKSGTQSLTSPTAAPSTEVFGSVAGAVYVGGTRYGTITSMSLQINGNTTQGEATVGSNVASDTQRGRVTVTGSFTALFDGETLATVFDQETTTSLIMVLADARTDAANTMAFVMSRVKLSSDDNDDGEKQIVGTYNFTASYNGSGGAALANHATIISVQDSQAA